MIVACINLSSKLNNVQLLVDWTRGKNLILSSGASSVTELRGPYDVANLSSLLGISMERAKAAVSKNCRYGQLRKILHQEILLAFLMFGNVFMVFAGLL